MRDPFVIAQLSDPHIGATWAVGDPIVGLASAVDSLQRLPHKPDAVVISGDLADNAAEDEYGVVRELVAQLGAPVYALAGNHDDRDILRGSFDLPGHIGAPLQYSADLGPMRLVVVDTTRVGEASGELDGERLEWLDAELAALPHQPTLLAMHHPPIPTGSRAWDEIGLPATDRIALGTVIRRHEQVRLIMAGHVHRTMAGELAGRAVVAIPSTYVQARLDLVSKIGFDEQRPGFALHVHLDGEVATQIEVLSQLPDGDGLG